MILVIQSYTMIPILTGYVIQSIREEIVEDSLQLAREAEALITREEALRKSDPQSVRKETEQSSLNPSCEGAAMPFVNKIEARAYARATEVLERVALSVQSVFPESLRQKLVMSRSKAEGQAGDAIIVITATLEGQENCEPVIDYVFEQMDSQSRRAVERSLDIRLDDDCIFFLRIDKQAAFLGIMKIAGESDLISARFHFKHYPRCKREEVLLLIENRLRSAGGSV